MNAFEIVARHYAEKAHIKLYFRDKCSPHTDAKNRIILPKCMNEDKLLATIAALLHEAHHIKLTGDMESLCNKLYHGPAKHWFGNHYSDISNFYKFLLNLCEDIRIDSKIMTKYEGAKYLYQELINLANQIRIEEKHGISEHTNKFIVLTQQIYLYALDFDESNYFEPEIIKDFISKNKEKLDAILKDVKACNEIPLSHGLVRPVDQLGNLVKDYLQMKDEKQPGGGSGSQAGGKQGNKEATKKLKEKLKQELDKKSDENKELEKQENKLKKDKEDLQEKIDKARQDRSKKQDKLNKMKRDGKDDEETDKLKEDIEDSYEDENEISEQKQEIDKDLRKNYKQKQENLDEMEDIGEDLETISKKKGDLDSEDIVDMEIDDADGYSLVGFKRLNKVSKRMKTSYEEMLNFESNLNQIFKRLEHKETYSHTTGKLNMKSIHKIFNHEGEVDDIFKHDRLTEKFNNKIIFLLDVSGSMGDFGRSHKNEVVWDCLLNMVKVIETNKENCNIEYGIYTFSSKNQFGEVKSFEDNGMTESQLEHKYRENYFNGGTDIIDALEKCYDMLELKSHNKDKKFIITITDAEFGYSEMNTILKEYNARQEKHIFIGINSKDYYNGDSKFFKEILMGRMVNSVKEMEATLLESFDRIL